MNRDNKIRKTSAKNAEEKIRQSEEKYRSIVEYSSDQIFMLDKDYRLLSLNKATADISKKSPQEMIGTSIFEVFPEKTAAQFSKNIKNVFDTGNTMQIEESSSSTGRGSHTHDKQAWRQVPKPVFISSGGGGGATSP